MALSDALLLKSHSSLPQSCCIFRMLRDQASTFSPALRNNTCRERSGSQNDKKQTGGGCSLVHASGPDSWSQPGLPHSAEAIACVPG